MPCIVVVLSEMHSVDDFSGRAEGRKIQILDLCLLVKLIGSRYRSHFQIEYNIGVAGLAGACREFPSNEAQSGKPPFCGDEACRYIACKCSLGFSLTAFWKIFSFSSSRRSTFKYLQLCFRLPADWSYLNESPSSFGSET